MEVSGGKAVDRRKCRLLQLLSEQPKADGAAARQLPAVPAAEASVGARIVWYEEGVGASHGYDARSSHGELVHPVQAQELHLVAVVQGVSAFVAQ